MLADVFEELESQVRSYCRGWPVVFERAQGSSMYAEDGTEHLDFFSGTGALNYGHSNCMHGSNGNITPYARSNVFIVYNSVENTCVEPFAADAPRPGFISAGDFTPVG